jgi:putative spermidine/putrescine transport system substrate-binding protein
MSPATPQDTRRPPARASTSRRTFLRTGAIVAVGASAPWPRVTRARAAGRVVVRTFGGAYEDALVKAAFDPFTRATGIDVVRVAATSTKLYAMLDSGRIEIDLLDTGDYGGLILRQRGGLERIDYGSFRLTNPADLDPAGRRDDMVGSIYYSNVLGYHTQAFPTGKHPRSWADFWDVNRFPGPRMLADVGSGAVELEFALLADGVPKDKLYPLDVERALRSLSRIRPAIRRFWDTGAISAQMLADKEVFAGSIWNGRIQVLIDKGAPLAIEWNEALLQLQFWAILKGTPNRENALRLIDFAMQPRVQTDLCRLIAYGPVNTKALAMLNRDELAKLPNSPDHVGKAIRHDVQWWADNRMRFSERWSQWLLQKG